MYDRTKKKKLPLKKFTSAEAIATFVNEGFECNLLDGEMIRNAHRNGCIGSAPAKAGRKPKIDEKDSDLLASLLFFCKLN